MSDPDPAPARAVVRLRPNIASQPLRRGAPWVYADQIVLDRRTRAIPSGSVVEVQDNERQPLGAAAFNGTSKIALRILDRDPAARIDADWFAARIARALSLRETLYGSPFYRLIHAEADGLPGVVIDRFGTAAVVQPNAAWAEARLFDLVAALERVTGVATVVKNGSGRARGLEGLSDESAVICGALDGPVAVPMNGATYLADLSRGQKTGLYFDQRPNHALVAQLARERRVLDVFSHVGGFALAALAGGAEFATAIDGSAAALDLARRGAILSGVADRFEARKSDAFAALEVMATESARFDLVICDPPAFAPSKSALDAGLRAYERLARLASGLVERDGFLVLCSCSHAADLATFREACLRGIGRAGRTAQLLHTGEAGPDHPVHPSLAESAYLKALFFRLGP